MYKRITVVLIFIYVLCLSSICNAYFSDIKDHWCEESINEFYAGKIVDGYPGDVFCPDKEITKIEFVKILNNFFGYELKTQDEITDWKEKHFNISKANGYINNFNFEDKISREEAVVIISKLIKIDTIDFPETLINYSDGDKISLWAKKSVNNMIEAGYLIGYENNNLRPTSNITRAEVVKILSRIIGKGGGGEDTIEIPLEDGELHIGIISHNDSGIVVEKLDSELTLNVGDVVTLAVILPEKEYTKDVIFEILSGNENITFDEETYVLETNSIGEAIIRISSSDKKFKDILKIIVKE